MLKFWRIRTRCFWKATFFVFLTLFAITASTIGQDSIVKVGAGSYTTKIPDGCKPLPRVIFKSSSNDQYVASNQWWSSLSWEKFSSNMFPHPLGVVASEKGLSVSYPGAAIVASKDAIMGGGVSEKGDLVIGFDSANDFDEARLGRHSDWFITAEFSQGKSLLKTSIGHGSPFVFCEFSNGVPRFEFFEKPVLWAGDAKSNAVAITIRGNHYALFGPAKSRWEILDEKAVRLKTSHDYFSVALLPDDQMATFELFKNLAHNHVVDTNFEYELKNGQLVTNWNVTTESKEPTDRSETIIALYPHQWKYSDASLPGRSYQSVRGEMKLVKGSGFRTSIPVQGVLPLLPPEGIVDRSQMEALLDAEIAKESPLFGDSYWDGKYLGKMASLSGIAESLGDNRRQSLIVDRIKSRLENWFVASDGESNPLFYYDDHFGTLIGCRPSYGSDDELNDHHFHYGYFIRAAAEVARSDEAWAKKWGPMVELIINDIVNVDESEKRFPRLRCFDAFAGHSWASGHARFGDGNNLESSSEAMNAWYGITLWGAATDNEELRDLGLFLFNTDRTAIEEYWFDASGTNFPGDFPNEAVGMVWGGKSSFATWFSGDPDHIHGISWLPFTPASLYLGRDQKYVARAYRSVSKKRKNGTDFNEGWGDLVVMFGALADPAIGVRHLEEFPNGNVESGNSHAFMHHWIRTLDMLGGIDASVTADYPFVTVFSKNGTKTYVAYGFGDQPLAVTFSDGKQLILRKRGLVVER